MSRALLIALAVYLIGYVICLAITIPLVIRAVHEDEREERGYIEPDTPDLSGRAFLVSMIFSLIWFLFIPLYVLMLAEKITGRGRGRLTQTKETEAQAQAIVFDWARWEQSKHPALKSMYHAANEGKRSRVAGANLKRQGMKPGVSDICLPYAAGGFNNLYIELKVGSNKATEEQLAFIDTINGIGGKAVIVYGSDAAIKVITAYLEGTIGSLDIKSDTYPAEKAKLTDRVNEKRFIGFCGTDCRTCNNAGCLGRKE